MNFSQLYLGEKGQLLHSESKSADPSNVSVQPYYANLISHPWTIHAQYLIVVPGIYATPSLLLSFSLFFFLTWNCRRSPAICTLPMLFLLLLMMLPVLASGSDAASLTATAETAPATLDPPSKTSTTFAYVYILMVLALYMSYMGVESCRGGGRGRGRGRAGSTLDPAGEVDMDQQPDNPNAGASGAAYVPQAAAPMEVIESVQLDAGAQLLPQPLVAASTDSTMDLGVPLLGPTVPVSSGGAPHPSPAAPVTLSAPATAQPGLVVKGEEAGTTAAVSRSPNNIRSRHVRKAQTDAKRNAREMLQPSEVEAMRAADRDARRRARAAAARDDAAAPSMIAYGSLYQTETPTPAQLRYFDSSMGLGGKDLSEHPPLYEDGSGPAIAALLKFHHDSGGWRQEDTTVWQHY